jgi:hypothetical protein
MARNATSAGNQQITGTYPQVRNQSKLSFSYFYNRSGNGTLQCISFGSSNNEIISNVHFSDNSIYTEVHNGAAPYGFISKAGISGWNHLALVFDGTQSTNATRLKMYFNGTQETLSFSGTIPATTRDNAGVELLRINRYLNSFGNGSYAELGVWQEPLSNADVAALSKGMTPDKVRPEKLVTYIPLVRDIQDVKSGTALTNTSSTVANHTRVYA